MNITPSQPLPLTPLSPAVGAAAPVRGDAQTAPVTPPLTSGAITAAGEVAGATGTAVAGSQAASAPGRNNGAPQGTAQPGADAARGGQGAEDAPGGPGQLSEEEQAQVRELAATDRRVRAHEAAHLAAAGGLARSGASFTYERGPDNRLYAVGGEVQIDTSAVAGDPEATLRKAQQIQRAALAPADPSSQDRSVAAAASQMAAEARADIAANGLSAGAPGDAAEAEPVRGVDAAGAGEEAASTACPACGGAHSAHAHGGLSAYAETTALAPTDPAGATYRA